MQSSSGEKIYSAHAFHPSLPNGSASGELRLSQSGFEFRSGDHAVRAPLAGAQMKLGGADDRLVLISHPQARDWSIYTSDWSILDDPAATTAPGLTSALRAIRRKRANTTARLAIAAALVIGAPLALLANMGALTAAAAHQVPPSWEATLGEAAFAHFRMQAEMLEDERTTELLRALIEPLEGALGASPYGFQFYVARDSTLNAFALPGGYIVLHSGLILHAESASELLGVLAHEIAHVTEQHGTRSLIGSAGAAAAIQALLGDASGLAAAMATAAPVLLTQKYSRSFEHEADREGFELLQRAGVDAAGMLSFFQKVKAEEDRAAERVREELGDGAGALIAGTPEFLSTHPATDARIDALRELAARQSPPRLNLDSAFRALKAHVKEQETRASRSALLVGGDGSEPATAHDLDESRAQHDCNRDECELRSEHERESGRGERNEGGHQAKELRGQMPGRANRVVEIVNPEQQKFHRSSPRVVAGTVATVSSPIP